MIWIAITDRQKSFICLVVQSLLENKDLIKGFIFNLNKSSPLLLGFTETRVTEDIEDFQIETKDYVTIRCNSLNRRTGGVIV